MISNELDIEYWRAMLAKDSRTQIADFLQPAAAEALARELNERVPWQLAERSDGQSRTSPRGEYPSSDAYAQLLQKCYTQAASDYQFAYDAYMLVKAAKYAWDPDLLVNGIVHFFNNPQYIEFIRYLTGDVGITHVNAQCTRYRPGQFLMPHDDQDEDDGRRYAYVLNLARGWRPDWGGQLQFLDSQDAVVQTMVPRWNSLSLFRVPQPHQVTLVSPWATESRLAITGWWLAR
jgi:SM-20-related protein